VADVAPAPAAQPAPQPEPAVRHPIEAAPGLAGGAEPPLSPSSLPALGESDAAVRDALTGAGMDAVVRILPAQGIVRRIVATIDNLPRRSIAPQVMAVRPVGGSFVVDREAGSPVIGRANAERYAPYVRLMQSIDTARLVRLYASLYPLFQQAYRELGYPSGEFNDRLVEVIDHLLATPEVMEPLRLAQPRVLYQFADPELEARSAGQKIMLRIGAANAKQVKAKLGEIRRAVAGPAPTS
jgi:hypothetical protein